MLRGRFAEERCNDEASKTFTARSFDDISNVHPVAVSRDAIFLRKNAICAVQLLTQVDWQATEIVQNLAALAELPALSPRKDLFRGTDALSPWLITGQLDTHSVLLLCADHFHMASPVPPGIAPEVGDYVTSAFTSAGADINTGFVLGSAYLVFFMHCGFAMVFSSPVSASYAAARPRVRRPMTSTWT